MKKINLKHFITAIVFAISLMILCSCEFLIEDMPHKHNYGEWEIVKEADCKSKGIMARYCECGESETETLPQLKHQYVPKVTPSTCLEAGYTTYTCSCGDYYISDYANLSAHRYDEWNIILEPTCANEGKKERICTVCGEAETISIPTVDHEIGEEDSNCCVCGKSRLSAPRNVFIDQDKIFWDKVINAEEYTVVVNGDYTYTTKNQFAYVRDAKDKNGTSISEHGEIIVTVMANSVRNYIYSRMSDEVLVYYIPTKEDDYNLSGLGIGRSYNLIENDVYNVEKASSNSVLNIEKLLGLGKYNKTDVNKTVFDTYSCTSGVDKYSQAVVKLGFETEIKYGIGNVKAGVSGATEQAIATHTYNHIYVVNGEIRYQMHIINNVNNLEALRMCLSENFTNDVKAVKDGMMTVEQLYEKYGTHAVLGVITGGSYTAQYVVSTNSKKISDQAAQEFGISTENKIGKIVDLNMKFDISKNGQSSSEWKDTKVNLSISYSGSNNAITLDASDISNSVKAYEEGIANNAVPFSLPENGTIPLVDLIKSMGEEYYDVANALADCLTKKCIAEFVEEMKSQKDEYYRFDGLFTAKDGGEKIVDENGVILVDISSVDVDTLYPQWTLVKTDVIFNAEGGTVDPDFKTVTIGSQYGSLPIPTKSGYAFLGWYLNGQKIVPEAIVTIVDDHTLVAQWLKIKGTQTLKTSDFNINNEVSCVRLMKFTFSLNLDRDSLITYDYKTMTIEVSIHAKGSSHWLFGTTDEPYVEVYSPDGKLLGRKFLNTFSDNEWQTQRFTITIDLCDVGTNGSFYLELKNQNGYDYYVDYVTIRYEANK